MPFPCQELNDDTVPVVLAFLPGPTRKRSETLYHYRLIHRNPRQDTAGCAMVWEVRGGRLVYQIALEREEVGTARFHCTCADAVFRAEGKGRFCKHIRGLLEWGQMQKTTPLAATAS